MGRPERSRELLLALLLFYSPGLQGVPGSRRGLGPTPGKEEVATSKYLPLGSPLTRQVEKGKRGLGWRGDDGGRPHRKASSTHRLLPATKEKGRGSVSRRELWVRGTGDDETGEVSAF